MANELDAFLELVKNKVTSSDLNWKDQTIRVWNTIVDSSGNAYAISDANAIADGEGVAGP